MRMTCRHAEDKIYKNRFTDAGVVPICNVCVWEAHNITKLCTRRDSLLIVMCNSVTHCRLYIFSLRLDCKENCEKAIEILNGTMLTGAHMHACRYHTLRVLCLFLRTGDYKVVFS